MFVYIAKKFNIKAITRSQEHCVPLPATWSTRLVMRTQPARLNGATSKCSFLAEQEVQAGYHDNLTKPAKQNPSGKLTKLRF